MTDKQPHKPVATLRSGRISALVWKNETDRGSFFAVTFSRVYSDAEGNLQNSSSFSNAELLILSRLAGKAYDQIAELRTNDATDDADHGD